jgi:ADP-ribosylglycohydrolase
MIDKRILGSLKGIALGDAIGKQTEGLSRGAVLRWYPDGVRGLEGTPGTVIPRYAGNVRHQWLIGETTDDTERTLAVARAILEDRDVRHTTVGREMLPCRKSVHEGVASLWEFHQANDPARVTDEHDGCGAAVRVAPVGMLHSSIQARAILRGARQASIPTHGGALALAAAAATATAVSAAVDGLQSRDIMELALRAAEVAERERTGGLDGILAERTRAMHEDLVRRHTLDPNDLSATYFPDSPLTIVPLAITLAVLMESAKDAILLAANIGGDSDSVASIAGGILGASHPETIDAQWYAAVEQVNGFGLEVEQIAAGLSGLRR